MTENSPTIAICYYGLPRSIRTVYANHAKYIFAPLRELSIRSSVFVHFWKIEGKQLVWGEEYEETPDYEAANLVQPWKLRLENQQDWLSSIDFTKYFYQRDFDQFHYHKHRGEWNAQLIKNHICALESQRRVTMLIDVAPQFVMYLRPDYELERPLDLSILSKLEDYQVALPSYRHFEGYNDTFSLMRWKTAVRFSKRIHGLPVFRANHGRIVSEKYLKYFLDKGGIKPIFHPVNYNIVRPDGSREFKDFQATYPVPRNI